MIKIKCTLNIYYYCCADCCLIEIYEIIYHPIYQTQKKIYQKKEIFIFIYLTSTFFCTIILFSSSCTPSISRLSPHL